MGDAIRCLDPSSEDDGRGQIARPFHPDRCRWTDGPGGLNIGRLSAAGHGGELLHVRLALIEVRGDPGRLTLHILRRIDVVECEGEVRAGEEERDVGSFRRLFLNVRCQGDLRTQSVVPDLEAVAQHRVCRALRRTDLQGEHRAHARLHLPKRGANILLVLHVRIGEFVGAGSLQSHPRHDPHDRDQSQGRHAVHTQRSPRRLRHHGDSTFADV